MRFGGMTDSTESLFLFKSPARGFIISKNVVILQSKTEMRMNFEQQIEDCGYCCVTLTARDFQAERQRQKFTIVLLCTHGEALVELNMERLRARSGSRLCYTHVMELRQIEVSPDFEALALVMNEQFSMESVVGVETELLQSLFSTPVRHIDDPKRWQLLLNLFESLRIYGSMDVGKFRHEIPRSIFRSIVIILGEAESGTAATHPQKGGYSMADNYFRNFINLINDHVQREHEVAFYAQHLCITPKYLNEICKLKSGHKAKEIISAILVNYIKRDLMYSGKSMKELASEFGFADQSSLGKFFRKLTGQSPLTFKRNQQ